MAEPTQPNGKRPRSWNSATIYHIVTVGDPNYRIPDSGKLPEGDTSHRLEERSHVDELGNTHHYRVVKADITIRPTRLRIPDALRRDQPASPPQDPQAEATGDAPQRLGTPRHDPARHRCPAGDHGSRSATAVRFAWRKRRIEEEIA